MTEVIGYIDHWSVRAGGSLTLHVHSDVAREVTADIVPLTTSGDAYVSGPAAANEASVTFTADVQRTRIGSYAELPLPSFDWSAPWTLSFLVRPTSIHPGVIAAFTGAGAQCLALCWTGASRLQLVSADGLVLGELPLAFGAWSVVALEVRDGLCTLRVHPHSQRRRIAHAQSCEWTRPTNRLDTLWLAACPAADGAMAEHFDGLLEAPVLHAEVLTDEVLHGMRCEPGWHASLPSTIAAWDFSTGSNSDRLADLGPSRSHGVLHQGPTRLIPGAYWRAGLLDPAREPLRFGAVHFHRDDQRDAGWTPSATITVPLDLPSGVYGVRVRGEQADAIDVIPFWVRAATPQAARPLAFLAPTCTYLAYGNAPNAMLGPAYWGGDHRSEHQRKLHHEFGPSLYSRHPDHSGVSLVSRHRPILTVRPGVRPWGFEADRLLTDWLHDQQYAFDVLTDEDIDVEGIEALAPHRVIVTGNHPEYWSSRMLDALDTWLQRGGRLVYTGGNGFYWRISSLASLPGVIECRRPEGGTRPWIAEPGCGYHQLDGEAAGLWRRLGRAPQQLVGVGFSGQGFERSAPYRINAAARDGWAGFVLRDVPDGLLGDTGLLGEGAAGQEIDRYDLRLGSSHDAVVLASSQGLHDAATLRTLEELLSHEPFAPDPKVRADIVLTPVSGGGAVFATGSMAWVGALRDAGVTRLMRNVLDRFLQPEPVAPADAGTTPTPDAR